MSTTIRKRETDRSGGANGAGGAGDVFGRVLSQVRAELSELVDAAVWSLDDARLETRLGQVLAVRASVDELAARFVSQLDDRDLAGAAGGSSTQAYLMAAYRMPRGAAAGLVASPRSMTERTEVTRQAWAAGLISADAAGLIGKAIAMLDEGIEPSCVHGAQVDLIDHAQTLGHSQLARLTHHLIEVIDPDGADAKLAEQLEAEEARALAATTFRGRTGLDGIASFSGKMPNLQFSMLRKGLEAVASPRRNQVNPPGTSPEKMRTGPGTSDVVDVDGAHSDTEIGVLTYGQRLGRAFCELIEHLPTDSLPQHGVANASMVVTIDEGRLRSGLGEATLDTGGVISAGEARRLACNAGLVPLVLGGDSKILDLGMTQRLFDRYQRLALAQRDGGCSFSGCDRSPAWCEAHHITAWSHGGPTDLTNGCLLCSFHHHLIHKRDWAIVMAVDGIPDVIPPARIDPEQRPIRHQRLKRRPG